MQGSHKPLSLKLSAARFCWIAANLGLLVTACGDGSDHESTGSGGMGATSGGAAAVGGGGSGGSGGAGSDGGAQAGTGGASTNPSLRRRLSIGWQHGCGLRSEGTITCWGEPESGLSAVTPPGGVFVDIGGMRDTNAAVAENGGAEIWGAETELLRPPSGVRFRQLAVGLHHACGVVSDDASIQCWGVNDFGKADAPPGEFAAVTVGLAHTCALTLAGPVFCWGHNGYSQIDSPIGGSYKSISSGSYHACAVRADNVMVCWGAGDADDPTDGSDPERRGQATPPAGEFQAVVAGHLHTCGIAQDGTVACWGVGKSTVDCDNGWECGQSLPPSGTFRELGLGAKHSCGIRSNGELECWGSDNFGRASPPADFR